ncbi:MAG: PQQ-dependent sugar dehydrogenase, partial [Chloroflexi bacterium]|nr:PQQ-dependent sugar dehydrogenase [Chloroflexota bacterium]
MVHLTQAGDGTHRLFVVLQHGLVYVFPNTPSVQPSDLHPFLDLRAQVLYEGEQGLLGLAFDPDYASNGYLYVHYTAANPRRSVISRFRVSADDADRADPSSELLLLEVEQPFSNHNGGTLAFGPDGHLYIGLGDGGSGGDPLGNGEDLTTLLGSLLRVDVRGATPQQLYRIPADNPFAAAGGGVRGEIWAYGLRNPWKFSFDRLSQRLWLADAGQNAWEEIDIVVPGGNYGWNRMEGS